MSSLALLAPVRRATHQRLQLLVHVGIIETLRPQVAGIAEHHLASLQQKEVIVGGEGSEPRFRRYLFDGMSDAVEIGAIRESESLSLGEKPAKERDESRAEERNA